MPTDAELLSRYATHRDEAAFAELVSRHVDLVYSAALRRVNGRADLAEEITQTVFTDLARKSGALARHPALVGWLYRATRYAAIDAARAEVRRRQLNETLSAMPEHLPTSEPAVDWTQVRPVLDEAMDHLTGRDREVVLLRFFQDLPYGEMSRRLHVSENAARMRTERALERLRVQLARRGVKSTAVLLGSLLATHTVTAAPAGLAGAVSSSALAAAPAGWLIMLQTVLLMKSTAAPVASAVLAATLTAVLWFATVDQVSADELESLRAENVQLTAATAGSLATDADILAAAASDYEARASRTLAGFDAGRTRRTEERATQDDSGHRNHGRATARDAELTFAWAAHEADVAALTDLIYFDPPVRERAGEIWSTMPADVQAAYPTPEALYAFFVAADGLVAPAPGIDVVEQLVFVEIGPGRAASRWPGRDRNMHEFQRMPDGTWKFVMPLVGVEHMPAVLQNETLARMGES